MPPRLLLSDDFFFFFLNQRVPVSQCVSACLGTVVDAARTDTASPSKVSAPTNICKHSLAAASQ